MSDVEFNPGENNYSYGYGGMRPVATGGVLVRLTMKLTGIQDEAKVNQILLGVALLFFLASAVVLITYL